MRQVFVYAVAYLLWAVTALLGALNVAVIRDMYQKALLLTPWHRYTLNAIDKFATVFLALSLVVLLIFWEHYYRTGMQRSRLLQRFCLMTAIELGLLFLAHAAGLVLQQSLRLAHVSNLYLLLEFCGFIVFTWLAYRLSHRRAYSG